MDAASPGGRTGPTSSQQLLLLVMKEGARGAAKALLKALLVAAGGVAKLVAVLLSHRALFISAPAKFAEVVRAALGTRLGRVLIAVAASLVGIQLRWAWVPVDSGANLQLSSSLSLLFGMIKLQGSMALHFGPPGTQLSDNPAGPNELRINCPQGLKEHIVRFLEAQAARDPAAMPSWQLSPQKRSPVPSAMPLSAAALPPRAPHSAEPDAQPPSPTASCAADATDAPESAAAAAIAAACYALPPPPPPVPVPVPTGALSTGVRPVAFGSSVAEASTDEDDGKPPGLSTPPLCGSVPAGTAVSATSTTTDAALLFDAAFAPHITFPPAPPPEADTPTSVPAAAHADAHVGKGAVASHHTSYTHPTYGAAHARHNPALLSALGPSNDEAPLDHMSYMSLIAHAATYKPSVAHETAEAAKAAASATGAGKQAEEQPSKQRQQQAGAGKGAATRGSGSKGAGVRSPESILGLRDMGLEGWESRSRNWERLHTE